MSESNANERPGDLREVTGVAWPIVVSMLSYTAMGVSDTLLVGWVGKTELAAVGLATTALFFINSFWVGTLHGVKVVVAQATGADRRLLATSSAWQGAYLALLFGATVAALVPVASVVFDIFGGPARVREVAEDYFVIRAFSMLAWYVAIAAFDYFQGSGDTKTPMKVNIFINALNIGLDVVLIFGVGPIPAYGVEGAAIATAVAQVTGMVLIITMLVRRIGVPVVPDLKVVADVVKVGVPIGVRYLLNVGGFAAFTAILARMGEDELAANQIAIKILSLSFLPGAGISEAASVLAGQYVGAGNDRAVVRSAWTSVGLATAVMGVFGLVFWLVPEPLIRMFQDDVAVVEIGRDLLLLAAIFQIFDAVAMTLSGALNGTGDTRFTMVISIVGSWFVMVPAAWYFGVYAGYGAWGAWLGLTLEIIVVALVLSARFVLGGWRGKAIVS